MQDAVNKFNKYYICVCGREFTKPQSYNAHLSHCKVHLGEDKHLKRLEQQKASLRKASSVMSQNAAEDRKLKMLEWSSEDHFCKNCGKQFYKKIGRGIFCSRSCANSRALELTTKEKISKSLSDPFKEKYNDNPNYCEVCGKTLAYSDRARKTCSDECLRVLSKINGIKFTDTLKSTYCARSGYYKNVFFASSWELAYWMWCELNNISIKRNTNYFQYYFNDDSRLYLPDFIINGNEYIEIKGTGVWYNKDEVESKLESVINSGAKCTILYRKDLKEIFRQVCDFYKVSGTVELSEVFYS